MFRRFQSTVPRATGRSRIRRTLVVLLLLNITTSVSAFQAASTQARTVRVEPASVELAIGESMQLRAEVLDADGDSIEDAPIVFFSLDREAVSVTPEGLVTAHRAGEFRVAALSPETIVPGEPADRTGRYDAGVRTEVVVRVPEPKPTGLTITGVPETVYAGTSFLLEVHAIDEIGATRRVDATLSSEDEATLRAAGGRRVEAMAPGDGVLVAAHGALSESIAVEIRPNPVATLELESSTDAALTGDVIALTATARDASGRAVEGVPVALALESWPDPAHPDSLGAGAPAQIAPDGRFVAEQPGVYVALATSGSAIARTAVTIRPRDARMDVELVGHAPIRDRVTSDLWVWEGVDGRDYAVVGTWNAEGHAYFYDVTDPTRMELIDTVQVDARTVNDVKVSEDGRIAVISREGASNRRNGLVILDVTDPRDVRVISRFDDQLTGGVHNVFVHDEHVYAVNNGRRFDVINIEDPSNPTRVSRFETDSPGRSVHDVWVADGIAYQAGRTDGLIVVDVGGGGHGGTPADPVEIARVPQLTGWNHSAWPFHSPSTGKTYVLGGDEAFYRHPLAPESGGILWREKLPSRAKGWIHFVDITDPDEPAEVARYQVPESGPHNYWIDHDSELLYIGHFDAGLRVVDISGDLMGDLYRQGREVARFFSDDSEGFIPNAPFVWGPQPHKGTIFFADFSSGLWAVRLKERQESTEAAPAFVAEAADAGETDAAAALRIAPEGLELREGESATLTAEEPVGATVVWFSLDPQAVSVDSDGRVTAHAAGEHEVVALLPGSGAPAPDVLQATDPGARVVVPVRVAAAATSRLELVGVPDTLTVGAAVPVSARLHTAAGEIRDVRPELEAHGDSDAVRIRPQGEIFEGSSNAHPFYHRERPALVPGEAAAVLEAAAPGEVTIRAVRDELSAETTVRIVENRAAELTLSATPEGRGGALRTGDVVRFSPTVTDASGAAVAGAPVRWAIEGRPDAERAESRAAGAPAHILDDGRFVAEQPGLYTVVATSGDAIGRATVEVAPRDVARGVEFLGQGPVRDRVTSDLWVWKGVDGRDYAVTGTWQAEGHAYFWDVTDPTDIRRIAEIQVDARTVNDVKVSEDGTLCVISREGASNRRNGLVILDCTDPAESRILSRFDEAMTGGVHNVFIHAGHVYAINNGRRWDVINIEDPSNPVRVGRFESDVPGRSVHDVWVRDGIAYQAGNTEGIVMVDVGGGNAGGSPDNPVEIGRLPQITGWNHAVWPFYSRSAGKFYVFAGDESHPVNPRDPANIINIDARMPSRAMGWIHVLDFEDPDNPREVARYRVPEAGPHNLWIDWEEEVMYVAYFNGGLRVVDISGELVGDLYRQGREIAKFYSDDPEGYVPNAPFVWGPQPHEGTIFFSDFHSGLWAIRLTEADERDGR